MRSIERRFSNLQQKQPELSSFMNFSDAIRGQGFSTGMIHRWFNKLVDRGDYENADKQVILEHLISLSAPEENRNLG